VLGKVSAGEAVHFHAVRHGQDMDGSPDMVGDEQQWVVGHRESPVKRHLMKTIIMYCRRVPEP
jgi:hypothetical protein